MDMATPTQGASLDTLPIRYLLEQDLPEIPRVLIEAEEIYFLTIIAATLLDGNDRLDHGSD